MCLLGIFRFTAMAVLFFCSSKLFAVSGSVCFRCNPLHFGRTETLANSTVQKNRSELKYYHEMQRFSFFHASIQFIALFVCFGVIFIFIFSFFHYIFARCLQPNKKWLFNFFFLSFCVFLLAYSVAIPTFAISVDDIIFFF